MASRKNFPDRVEARRQRALNRSAQTSGLEAEAPRAAPYLTPAERAGGVNLDRHAEMHHPQLTLELGDDDFPVGDTTGRGGYVYVLLTGYTDRTGEPLVKIGRTSRTPDHRNREISRGGPVGTRIVGAVTTRDTVGLERKVHQAFSRVRFAAGGGTEYFAVNPDEVLAWLRTETPRYEIESARDSAWQEYVESPPWKASSAVALTGHVIFLILWFGGSFWLIRKHLPWLLLIMPIIGGVATMGIWRYLKQMLLHNVDEELRATRCALEEKYHLPKDTLLSGPTMRYKHNSRRGLR